MEVNNPANPPKFSRYRTVRARAATLQTLSSQSDSDPAPAAPLPLPKAATFSPVNSDAQGKRAPSRYRRNNPGSTEVPPLPQIKDEHATSDLSNTAKQHTTLPSRYHNTIKSPKAHADPPSQPSQSHSINKDARRKEDEHHTLRPGPPPAPTDRYEAAREEARLILEGEYDRLHRMRADAEKRRHLAGYAVGSHAPDMKKRRDPLKQQDSSSSRPGSVPEHQPAIQSPPPVPDLMEGLPKHVPPPAASPVSPPASPKRALRKYIFGSPRQDRPNLSSQPHTSPPQTARTEVAPPLPLPQYADSPLSASNAPDRRVTVTFDTSTITLPVTPSTTAKDLLNSASVVLSAAPDPRTSTLLETYTSHTLSLERPIRRYERIRDIMNSWDSDTDQHLMILAPDPTTNGNEPAVKGLDLKDVPPTAGADITLQMQYSARPGRWEKRWVRVQPNGQVSVSKHESGSDATNICHLSDFDLYAPTRKMLKRLKPPSGGRKGKDAAVVFATKSQQKSAMFLNDDDEAGGGGAERLGVRGKKNFAHFFAFAGDKGVADTWYAAVHGWRSWYLVNVLGEGRVPTAGTGEVLGEARSELRTHARKASLHQHQHQYQQQQGAAGSRPSTSASADTVPYQLGSFKPMLDLDFSKIGAAEQAGGGGVGPGPLSAPAAAGGGVARRRSIDLRADGHGHEHRHSPSRSGTVRGRPGGAPPTAFPSRFVLDAVDGSQQQQQDGSGFTGKGLLAQPQADPSLGVAGAGPFEDTNLGFTGRGLLARSATQRSQGGRGTGRGVSGQGGKGKPLVDLTGHSEFADGSLLRQLEAWKVKNGDDGGKVDREKRVEGNVRVGERFRYGDD